MIHFHQDKFYKTLKKIESSYDCADVLNDLNRINQAIENINLYGYCPTANQLDQELRKKYPCIDNMLRFANSIPVSAPKTSKSYYENETILRLNQDRCGIICDTAIKKHIVCNLNEFIEYVD